MLAQAEILLRLAVLRGYQSEVGVGLKRLKQVLTIDTELKYYGFSESWAFGEKGIRNYYKSHDESIWLKKAASLYFTPNSFP